MGSGQTPLERATSTSRPGRPARAPPVPRRPRPPGPGRRAMPSHHGGGLEHGPDERQGAQPAGPRQRGRPSPQRQSDRSERRPPRRWTKAKRRPARRQQEAADGGDERRRALSGTRVHHRKAKRVHGVDAGSARAAPPATTAIPAERDGRRGSPPPMMSRRITADVLSARSTAARSSVGAVTGRRWPAPGHRVRRLPGSLAASDRATSAGTSVSSSPHTNSTGQRRRARSSS